MKEEVYVSVAIETNGPIPGDYSMLSLGSVALMGAGNKNPTFIANYEELPTAKRDPDTMALWEKNYEAYRATRVRPQDPYDCTHRYKQWLEGLGGSPVFVGYTATFDFPFVHWYLIHFTDSDPYGFSALDVRSYSFAKLGGTFRGCTKKVWPKEWNDKDHFHSHQALEDAVEQGYSWERMRDEKP